MYKANLQNAEIDAKAIKYPSADSTKIFNFIDEVQSQVVNNALVPFSDFEEMQSYLKQQWASMLQRFLTTEGEAKRTADILEALGKANDRIEFLTRRIVESVGNPLTKATVQLYDILLNSDLTHDFQLWHVPVSPKRVLAKSTYDEFCDNQVQVEADMEGFWIAGGGPPFRLSKAQHDAHAKAYIRLRQQLLDALSKKGIPLSDYTNSEEP